MPAEKDFSISQQKRLWMSAIRVCVPDAQCFFRRSKKFLFLVVWPSGLLFWRESKIKTRFYWRCVFSWQIMFQRRQMRISWLLCDKLEIHLWFWKAWSLVVCSQGSFYVTRASKDDKKRQNTFLVAEKKEEMNLVHKKQLFFIVSFQSTKFRKKELCVDNKIQ